MCFIIIGFNKQIKKTFTIEKVINNGNKLERNAAKELLGVLGMPN